jgi:uncharacterized protein YkwD
MQRLAAVQQELLDQGVNNQSILSIEAGRLALAGDLNASLDNLQHAIESGLIGGADLAVEYPALAVLVGEPRFAELQARMNERRNEERAKLGLEPLSI